MERRQLTENEDNRALPVAPHALVNPATTSQRQPQHHKRSFHGSRTPPRARRRYAPPVHVGQFTVSTQGRTLRPYGRSGIRARGLSGKPAGGHGRRCPVCPSAAKGLGGAQRLGLLLVAGG